MFICGKETFPHCAPSEPADLLRQAHAAAERMGIPEADQIGDIQGKHSDPGRVSCEASQLWRHENGQPTADDLGPAKLGPFLEQYNALRSDVKDSTRLQYQCAIRSLISFFGAEKRLDEITAADAESWSHDV